MRAGQLNDRLEIQTRTLARDGYGDMLPTWTTVATRWGKIDPQSAGEVQFAGQPTPVIVVNITLRYFDGLTDMYRLKKGTRIFYILGVINKDEKQRAHLCFCREVVEE